MGMNGMTLYRAVLELDKNVPPLVSGVASGGEKE